MAKRTSTTRVKDKEDVLKRLRKMEGQVRGLQQMVEDDRYCLDIVQQIDALTAAGRKISVIVLEEHLRTCVAAATKHDNADAAIQEIVTVLNKALHQ
jgi:CsoR family transcriptional regulator, copper-sensing transcriptional repressor